MFDATMYLKAFVDSYEAKSSQKSFQDLYLMDPCKVGRLTFDARTGEPFKLRGGEDPKKGERFVTVFPFARGAFP